MGRQRISVADTALRHEIHLGEEEISDISLATFYVFDKENAGTLRPGVQLAWRAAEAAVAAEAACRGCRGWGVRRLRRLRRLLSLLKCPHDHAARIQGWCGGFVTTTQPRIVTIRTHTPTSGAITAPNTNLTGFPGRSKWN